MAGKIAIVGAGLIGRSWAITFARGGHEVALYDVDAGQTAWALETIARSLADMEEAGLIAGAGALKGLIRKATGLAAALDGACHVQENVAEQLDVKRQVFTEIETLAAKDAVLASSSSALMPSLIFEDLKGRERCLVAHPMNPPHLAPIVELCGAPFTGPETLARARETFTACGMAPITVRREIDGFILNRLQHAVLNEAFRLIANGYVSAGDLDLTMKDGLALRWSFMGPIETIDLNAPGGVADYMARYGETIRRVGHDIAQSRDWPDEVTAIMDAERRGAVPCETLDAEQAWRDRRLMALAVHKQDAAKRFGK
jgi:3-hydroxyacyl-CoA dehydrogenase